MTNNCGCTENYNVCDDKCPQIEPASTNDIEYVGDTDICLNIVRPSTLTQMLDQMRSYVKNRLFGIFSRSLVVTYLPNSCDRIANVELVPSVDAGNTLTLGTDGRPYVGQLNLVNSSCISFIRSTVNGVPTITPSVNWQCVSQMVCPLCTPTSSPCTQSANLNIT